MSNLFSEQSPWRNRSVAIGSILFAASMFAACGDEVTEVTEATEVTQVVGMQVVKEGDSLPKCSAENEGAMVYSVDSSAAYYCVNKKWTALKGKDGKDGVDGKDGKDGVDGKDGKDGADGKNGKDGKNGTNGTNGTNGSSESSCTAVAIDNGYKIVCGGDSVGVVLNGKDGQDGAKGDSGVAGTSCSAEEVSGGVKITCTDGKSFTLHNGADGTSCSAEEVAGGVKISCTDGKSFMLHNGADGKDGKSFVDGWMVDPRDKQPYRVVTIGEQTWMAENLNYRVDSSFCYKDSAKYCEKYGRFYKWAAAIDKPEKECSAGQTCGLSGKIRGVCPEGWHLPDTTEWNTLFAEVGESAGKMLKSQTGWNDDYNGIDAYGFSALPIGYRDYGGEYSDSSYTADFWSATECNGSYSYGIFMNEDYAFIYDFSLSYALAVRCLMD